MRRPNFTNLIDACCRCGKLLPTPAKDAPLDLPVTDPDVLHVWQPDGEIIPQWICKSCHESLTLEAQKW